MKMESKLVNTVNYFWFTDCNNDAAQYKEELQDSTQRKQEKIPM